MSFTISNITRTCALMPGYKDHFYLSCAYDLNEADGSIYRVKRLFEGCNRPHARKWVSKPLSPALINILNCCEYTDHGLTAIGAAYKDIQTKVLIVAAPIIDNTLQVTQQQLAITQQAQAALQREAAIAQQNLAAVQQQAVIAEQQAAVLRQNLAATQQQAAIAQQQAAILQRDLAANQQQLALSVEEIANLKGQNLFLYSLVKEKNQELSLLIADRNANIERRQILEGQIANLLVLIRQYINSGR